MRSLKASLSKLYCCAIMYSRYSLCKGWQNGSKLTPAPYEKAQTSEEKIYMQAVRSSRQSGSNVQSLCEKALTAIAIKARDVSV